MSGGSVGRLALATSIAIFFALQIPMWTATQAMLSTRSALSIPTIVIAYLFSAILPIFYFALYRNGAPPPLSKGLRALCPAGALAGASVMAAGLPEWMESGRPFLTTVKMLLTDLGNLSCILLLLALFLYAPGIVVPMSRMLRVATRVAAVGGGLWFILNLAGLVLAPEGGKAGAIRTLAEQVCLFTAPYVVYLSSTRRTTATFGTTPTSKTQRF